MKINLLIGLGILILLNACQIHAPKNNTSWQAQRSWQAFNASGRLSVKIGDQGQVAHFDWTRQDNVETFDVNTPIGTTVGQLCQDSEGVLAMDNQNHQYTAPNAEILSEQLLGYTLPVQYLGVWMNGEWVKDIPYKINTDGSLQQLGWNISRESDTDGLVRIISLSNAHLTLRLAFSQVERQAGIAQRFARCDARER